MKYKLCLPLTLLLLICLIAAGMTACNPRSNSPETEAATSAVTEAPTGSEEDTTDKTASDTEAAITEPVTTEAPFVLTALPPANVAREGFAVASRTKYNSHAIYSNVNVNDGDINSGYSNEWGVDFDASKEHYLFIDLTERRVIDHLKIYPYVEDEGGLPSAFDVFVSDDGKTYRKHTSASGVTPEAAKDGYIVDMDEVEAGFVKLVFTAYGPGDEKRGVHISLGEVEVYSPIDTATNMQLNLDDIWLFMDPDTSHQLAISYYRDGTPVDPNKKLTYISRDPAIAAVSEDGLITPVSYGKTEIEVFDGVNRATCAVEVRKDFYEEEFLVSTFFITYYVMPGKLEEAIDLTVKSGVTHLETPHWWDHENNDIHLYALHLCRERGATYTPNDESASILNMPEKKLLGVLQEYENRAGFVGLFITDEPSTTYTQYAEVYRILQEYNPHYVHHLNLLPLPAVPGGQNEYYTEFAAVAGGTRRLRYLTFDQYPFVSPTAMDSGIYYSLDMMRKAGLMYNADTGLYLQTIVANNFPMLGIGARRYNVSLALAYGMKNIKHYIGLPPINEDGSYTDVISGILKPDITPADYFDELIDVNAYAKSAGKLLVGADAVEVYHSAADGPATVVPPNFFIQVSKEHPVIYSIFRELDGSRQYVVLTDKRFTTPESSSISFTINRDIGALRVFDPVTEETTELAYTVGAEFSLNFLSGQCLILLLEEGVDVTTSGETSDNLMLGKGVFVSTSQAEFWVDGIVGSHHLTDGDPGNGVWLSHSADRKPNFTLDLGEVQEGLGRLELTISAHVLDNQIMDNFKVEVSADGKTFTEVITVTDAVYEGADKIKVFTVELGGAAARYIRVSSTEKHTIGIAEVAVYKG